MAVETGDKNELEHGAAGPDGIADGDGEHRRRRGALVTNEISRTEVEQQALSETDELPEQPVHVESDVEFDVVLDPPDEPAPVAALPEEIVDLEESAPVIAGVAPPVAPLARAGAADLSVPARALTETSPAATMPSPSASSSSLSAQPVPVASASFGASSEDSVPEVDALLAAVELVAEHAAVAPLPPMTPVTPTAESMDAAAAALGSEAVPTVVEDPPSLVAVVVPTIDKAAQARDASADVSAEVVEELSSAELEEEHLAESAAIRHASVPPPAPPPMATAAAATSAASGGGSGGLGVSGNFPPAVGTSAAPPAAPKPRDPPRPPPPSRVAEAVLEPRSKKRKSRAWWEDIFDEDYLRTLPFLTPQATQREAAFLIEGLGVKPGQHILDLGCGYGRHAMELAARGFHVVALDQSLPLLLRGADEAQRRGLNINFVHSDMRDLAYDGRFDGAYCVFSTFGFFDDDTNKRVALGLARALKPGARLVLDILNRDYILADLPTRVWWEGESCVVLEEVDFNYFTSRLINNRQIVFEDGRQLEQEISIRAYSLHEIGKLLHGAGFRVIQISGGVAARGRFFGKDSRQIIIVAEKRPESPRESGSFPVVPSLSGKLP